MKPNLTAWQAIKAAIGALFLMCALKMFEESMTDASAIAFLRLTESLNDDK